jgi:hypothetical protein
MGLFEFGDFGLSGENPDICIDLIEGFMTLAGYRGRDWIVPRLDGEEPGNRRKGKLILPAAGFVKGSGPTPQARREAFLLNITDVLTALEPAGSASVGVKTLRLSQGYLGLPVGSEATIEGRVRSLASGRMESGQSLQRLTLEFECYVPTWEIGS